MENQSFENTAIISQTEIDSVLNELQENNYLSENILDTAKQVFYDVLNILNRLTPEESSTVKSSLSIEKLKDPKQAGEIITDITLIVEKYQ